MIQNWDFSQLIIHLKKQNENARGSGDNQTEGDGEESVEHLQPDGTVAGDDILVPK